MNWINLESVDDLDELISNSSSEDFEGVAIFKHSTRCPISTMAQNRLSSKWGFGSSLPIYYLDLIRYRDLSNLIAQKFSVEHESPQFLLIKNGKCVYNTSHNDISVQGIATFLEIKN